MWFAFAVVSALFFGVRGILYQWSSQRPMDRNVLLLGVYISGALITLSANLVFQQTWSSGVWWGILMGLFSFVANAAMLKGYAVGRASTVALFTALPPVVVVILAYFLFAEALGLAELAGFCIVIVGLLFIRYSGDLKLGQLQGLIWGLLTMVFFGLADVTSKQATIFDAETLPVLTVMFGTGSLLFAWNSLRDKLHGEQRKLMKVTEVSGKATSEVEGEQLEELPGEVKGVWSTRRTLLWGMIVGISNVTGMILIVSAFREGVTGIVSAIVAMNVVVILLYVRLYLKEVFTKRESIGMVLALLGIVVLRVAA